jgi:hypothetical protein
MTTLLVLKRFCSIQVSGDRVKNTGGNLLNSKSLPTKDVFLACVALTRFWRDILFLFHPLLETTLEDAPLSTNLKGRDLAVLNHSMQRSFRNL